jgi:UDP-glucose 4,6-dehydratase
VRQVSHSSSRPLVARGLHTSPYPKLVLVTAGAVAECVVDLRRESPTFLRSEVVVIRATDGVGMFVPAGCGHGFVTAVPRDDATTMSPGGGAEQQVDGAFHGAAMVYLQGGEYDPEREANVHWLDPDLAIPWELAGVDPARISLSAKDAASPRVVELLGTATVAAAVAARDAGMAYLAVDSAEAKVGSVQVRSLAPAFHQSAAPNPCAAATEHAAQGDGITAAGVVAPTPAAGPGSSSVVDERVRAEAEASRRMRILVFGSRGYIGSHLVRAVRAAGHIVAEASPGARVENRSQVDVELSRHAPDAVISAAGLPGGTDSIDWCETHREETVRVNVLGQLTLAEACAARGGLHLTVIGTGALYGARASESPRTEDEPADHTPSFYARTRVQMESLLSAYRNNVAVARILYPLSGCGHPRSLVTKLLGFPKVRVARTSVSVLEEIAPAIVRIAERGATGVFHATNPGTTDNDEILRIYRDTVDATRTWVVDDDNNDASSSSAAGPRAACELSADKLLALCAEDRVRGLPALRVSPARDAVAASMRRLASGTSASPTSSCSPSGSASSTTSSESSAAAAATPPPSTQSASSEYTPRSILLTGGAGFIGSHVCAHLVAKYPGCRMVCLDILDYCASMNNLAPCLGRANFTFVRGDISDTRLVREILETHAIDTVLHFAAQSHVDLSFGMSMEFTRVNVLGTHALLESAKNAPGVERFVFVSTDEVYGEVINNAHALETATLDPTNPYSASKAAAEMLVKAYVRSYGLKVIIVRGNNVYGAAQFPEKVIPKFILRLLRGERCCVHGTGDQKRTYLHVRDVAEAFDVIVHRGVPGEVYNIGTNDPRFEFTMLTLARVLVRGVLGADADPAAWIEHVEDRAFNDCRYSVEVGKLGLLGWAPRVAFEDGLREVIQWYRDMPRDHWPSYEYALAAHPLLHEDSPLITHGAGAASGPTKP